jgi:hypothetical protein
MKAAIFLVHIQLTCKRANGDILPLNRTSVISQLANVIVHGIIETEIASRMLI